MAAKKATADESKTPETNHLLANVQGTPLIYGYVDGPGQAVAGDRSIATFSRPGLINPQTGAQEPDKLIIKHERALGMIILGDKEEHWAVQKEALDKCVEREKKKVPPAFIGPYETVDEFLTAVDKVRPKLPEEASAIAEGKLAKSEAEKNAVIAERNQLKNKVEELQKQLEESKK